jgi:3D (Asp-Asp-Asp) domain-containing protein
MKYLLLLLPIVFLALLVPYQFTATGSPEISQQKIEEQSLLPERGQSSVEKTIKIVTAYSELDSCHYKGCPMANGKKAQVGYAACPRDIKLGTKIEIEGIGELICGDRTAKSLDGRYDVFMGMGNESYIKAKEFGIKELEVRIE